MLTQGISVLASLADRSRALGAAVPRGALPDAHRGRYLAILDRWAAFAQALADHQVGEGDPEAVREASFDAEGAANDLLKEVEHTDLDWLEITLRCMIEASIASRWVADARVDGAILSGHVQLGAATDDLREVLKRPAAGPAEGPLPHGLAVLEWTWLLAYAVTVQAWVNGQAHVDAGRSGSSLDERLQRIVQEGARCDELFEALEGVRQSYQLGRGDGEELVALRTGYRRVFVPWFDHLFAGWRDRVAPGALPRPPSPSFLMARGVLRRWVANPELERALDAARTCHDMAVLMGDGDGGEARRAAEACVTLDGDDPRGWFLLGVAAAEAGDTSLALRALRRSSDLGGPDAAVLGKLGEALRAADDATAAAKALERAAAAGTGPVSEWLERVDAATLRARAVRARRWGVDVSDHYRVLQAQALLDAGDFAGAADVMRGVHERHPGLAGDAAGLLARAAVTTQLRTWSGFTVQRSWRPTHGPATSFPEPVRRFLGGEDGRSYLLPLSHEAVTGTLRVTRELESTLPLGEHEAALVSGVRKIAEDQALRRFGGGCAVPAASALLGVGILTSASSASGTLASGLVGLCYVGCAALYIPASQVQTWRLNNRSVGESGGFLSNMAKEGILGALMGFFCLGAFAPLVVAWNYVTNHLSNGAGERPRFES